MKIEMVTGANMEGFTWHGYRAHYDGMTTAFYVESLSHMVCLSNENDGKAYVYRYRVNNWGERSVEQQLGGIEKKEMPALIMLLIHAHQYLAVKEKA